MLPFEVGSPPQLVRTARGKVSHHFFGYGHSGRDDRGRLISAAIGIASAGIVPVIVPEAGGGGDTAAAAGSSRGVFALLQVEDKTEGRPRDGPKGGETSGWAPALAMFGGGGEAQDSHWTRTAIREMREECGAALHAAVDVVCQKACSPPSTVGPAYQGQLEPGSFVRAAHCQVWVELVKSPPGSPTNWTVSERDPSTVMPLLSQNQTRKPEWTWDSEEMVKIRSNIKFELQGALREWTGPQA